MKTFVKKKSYEYIVRQYIDYLYKIDANLTSYQLKELLRHSLCKALGLSSKASSKYIENLSVGCSDYLSGGIDISNMTLENKHSLLEACVHVLDITVSNAERGNTK